MAAPVSLHLSARFNIHNPAPDCKFSVKLPDNVSKTRTFVNSLIPQRFPFVLLSAEKLNILHVLGLAE